MRSKEMRTGKLKIAEIPAPLALPGEILIATVASAISAGSERMVIDFAKRSILGTAREQPDLVRGVIEKCRSEGSLPMIRQVREELDTSAPLGYSSAGVVLACGSGVQQFKPGDRVASNGPPVAIASVNKRLCARIPHDVDFDQAAFAPLGAIALQGVRLSRADLGETVLVVGLGLIGQLTVGLLAAAGCRVLATDPDSTKCELARQKMGAELARPNLSAVEVESLTAGLGADVVVITASTCSSGSIGLAAAVRKRGRVVLVGVVGLEPDWRPFYFKEAEFVVSCSYGPGRYDSNYEDRGYDYPAGYVRWTEQRNIQAVLDLVSRRKLDIRPLISHRFPIDEAVRAYDLIERGQEAYLGILLEYPHQQHATPQSEVRLLRPSRTGRPAIGVLAPENIADLALMQALHGSGRLHLRTLCTSGGTSALAGGRKLEFEKATSDEDELFDDPDLDAVVSLTRHDLHARQVIRALRSGKAVFVERPLCLTLDELAEIDQVLNEGGDGAPFVMVGFNRRFSPAAVAARRFFADVKAPLTAAFRFNAGPITPDLLAQDDAEDGGRIVGEVCHGIDLVTFLVNSPPVRVFAESIGVAAAPLITGDQCFITLRHANGAVSTVAYLAGGDQAVAKERVEVIGGGRIAVIDDFRALTTCCGGRTNRTKYRGQDQGHTAEIEAFGRSLDKGGTLPIPWEQMRSVTLASILAVRSLRQGIPVDLP